MINVKCDFQNRPTLVGKNLWISPDESLAPPNNQINVRDFDCSFNRLSDLVGGPLSVHGDYICHHNVLTSLEGAPSHINGTFNCAVNNLTNLSGAPKHVGANFIVHGNPLDNLDGIPEKIIGRLSLSLVQRLSLSGIHEQNLKLGSFAITRSSSPGSATLSMGSPVINPNLISSVLGLMLIEIPGHINTQCGVMTGARCTDIDVILNKWKNQGRKGVMGAMKELLDLGYDKLAQI